MSVKYAHFVTLELVLSSLLNRGFSFRQTHVFGVCLGMFFVVSALVRDRTI